MNVVGLIPAPLQNVRSRSGHGGHLSVRTAARPRDPDAAILTTHMGGRSGSAKSSQLLHSQPNQVGECWELDATCRSPGTLAPAIQCGCGPLNPARAIAGLGRAARAGIVDSGARRRCAFCASWPTRNLQTKKGDDLPTLACVSKDIPCPSFHYATPLRFVRCSDGSGRIRTEIIAILATAQPADRRHIRFAARAASLC